MAPSSSRHPQAFGRAVRAVVIVASALGIALVVGTMLTLPPRRPQVPRSAWRPTLDVPVVRGAYHLHTNRSDGSGSLDEVALAAARAGLDFLVVTDHGNGTSPREPAHYRSGVLLIDGIEISTTGGHYVALGMPAAPYPLAGDPTDVVEDVARLGGLGIAAHPDSPKRALRWRAWDAPIDGFEWLNADTEWRDESRWRLARVLLQYPLRPVESVATLFSRPAPALERFDAFGRAGRRVVVLGGTDAHARIGPRGLPDDEETDGDAGDGMTLHVPSYENTFRLVTLQATPSFPFSGQAVRDEALLLDAIRSGRVSTVVDGLAAGGRLEFYATRGAEIVQMGQRVPVDGPPMAYHATVAAPPGGHVVLRRNGTVVAESTGLDLVHVVQSEHLAEGERSAQYRIEVLLDRASDGASLPWIVSNAIMLDGSAAQPLAPPAPGTPALFTLFGAAVSPWKVEKDDASTLSTAIEAEPQRLGMQFTLGPAGHERWVALAWPLPSRLAPRSSVVLKAAADAPTRIWLQLRSSSGAGDLRWRRSVYLDAGGGERVVPLDAFVPVNAAAAAASREAADVLLVVADTTHHAHGRPATVWLERLDVY